MRNDPFRCSGRNAVRWPVLEGVEGEGLLLEPRAKAIASVVYLPDAYLPTDAGLKISDRTPTRQECGLPDTGIVFCSFSHDFHLGWATNCTGSEEEERSRAVGGEGHARR